MDRAKLFRLLKAHGCSVRSQGGHYAVSGPDGRRIATLAKSASDHRSTLNAVADLRRAGIRIPRKTES